jgi:hypothetical protein
MPVDLLQPEKGIANGRTLAAKRRELLYPFLGFLGLFARLSPSCDRIMNNSGIPSNVDFTVA